MTDEPDEQPTEPQYEIVMPFVVTQSNGGPYDDDAFVAGWYAAELDIVLEQMARFHCGMARTVPTPLVPQIDLIAMKYGFYFEHEPCEDAEGWSNVQILKTAPDAEEEDGT